MYLNLRGREQSGSRRPWRRSGGAEGRDHRQAARPARRRTARRRRARGVRHRRALQRTLPGERARLDHRLQRRLPRVVGRRHRRRRRARCSRTTSRRGAATTASIPRLVPGVLFCNRKVSAEGDLSIVDVAPDGPAPVRPATAGAHGRASLGRRAHDRRHATPSLARAGGRRARAGLRGAATHTDRTAGDRARHRRPRLSPGPRARRPGPSAAPGAPRRRRALHAARHHDAATQSGGLVDVHHRPRPGRARHLRFHPSPPRHARVVPLHVADRAPRGAC